MSKGIEGKRNIENILKRISEIDSELYFFINSKAMEEEFSIEEREFEKIALNHELKILIDRRDNNTLDKIIWNIIVPILVSTVVAYITVKLI